jgi:LCP family protein required for cell wall assembly
MRNSALRVLLAIFGLSLITACSRNDMRKSPDASNQDSALSFSQDVDLLKDPLQSEIPVITFQADSNQDSVNPPTNMPSVESSETPAISQTATLPPPAAVMEPPQDIETVVLLGTDYLSPITGRTDTIILLLVNQENGSASLISVPRDLYVYRPGYGMGRVNTVFAQGGPDLLFDTLEYNLGIRPEHWALAHLDDFINFVNDLGGVDVQVNKPLPYDCGGVPAGLVHMDGYIALCYVRERRTSSDFARSKRQQEVLRVLFNKFFTLENMLDLPDWYARYSGSMKSDFGLLDLIDYLPFALHLQDVNGIHNFQIGMDDVEPVRLPESGASVLLPDQNRIESILQEAVDILAISKPTSENLPTRLFWLTATPTETPTPEPVGTQVFAPGDGDKQSTTGTPTESADGY